MVDDLSGTVARGVDRATRCRGRWPAATRARSGAASTPPGSGSRCCILFVAAVRRPAQPAADAAPRPARAHGLLGRAGVLQRTRTGRRSRRRWSSRCSSTCSCGCCGRVVAPRPARAGAPAAAPAGAGLLAGDRGRVPGRLPHRPEPHRLQRHRRRLRRRDRGRPPHRRASRSTATSQATTSTATRTARSPTSRTSRSRRCCPWSGTWDDLPAAHGAALVFDLAVVALLFLLGRRIRGPAHGRRAGLRLAGLPVLAVRREHERQRRPPRRARARRAAGVGEPVGPGDPHRPGRADEVRARWRSCRSSRARRGGIARFGLAFLATAVVVSIPIFLHGGTLRDFWDATLGYQADRASPFSIYGLWGHLGWLHRPRAGRCGRARARGARCCPAAATSSASPPSRPPCSSPSSSR